MEQGAFTALEFLLSSGRLAYSDYESWRRREIELLDSVLMGNPAKIRSQMEQAAGYCLDMGLVEQLQEFPAWHSEHSLADGDKPLRISADSQLERLIGSRFTPARNAPQMDLFFDNPVVALTNGIARSLSARHLPEAQRQVDQLYALAPNHADLAAFDTLVTALHRMQAPVEDSRQELSLLLDIAPTAKRLLGAQSRDLLAPRWRELADTLTGRPFTAEEPNLHRSFVLAQAQDWPGVSNAVLAEPDWWLHSPLCLLFAQSGFYRQQRTDTLKAWCHLCWRFPDQAADILDRRRQPDSGLTRLWQQFRDCEDGEDDWHAPLGPTDFPAWLLLIEPGLTRQLDVDLAGEASPGERHYRCVHALIQARRSKQTREEMELRKQLKELQPGLFGYLQRIIGV